MNAVYYGKEPMLNFIKHCNIPNYKIYIAERNTSNAVPIFSSTTDNMKTALNDFNMFSDNILLGNPTDDTVYYIKFYKKNVPQHNNESYFSYNKVKEESLAGIGGGSGSLTDIIGLMHSIMPMAKAQAENEMLKDRLEDLENAQAEPETNVTEQIIGALGAILPQILGGGSSGVQIAGTETKQDPGTEVLSDRHDSKKELLERAIKILSDHDPEIETDLYKLSQIAVNNPAQFKMLIDMLRNM